MVDCVSGKAVQAASDATHGESRSGASLLDRLIDAAPELVRSRRFLPAADWREATPAQIARLLQTLAAARLAVPKWLARDILVAGHTVDAATHAHLAPELRLLAALNALPAGCALPEALRHELIELRQADGVDDAVAAAVVARVVAVDAAAAGELALHLSRRIPSVLRSARKPVAGAVAELPALGAVLTGFSTTQPLAQALQLSFARIGKRLEVSETPYGTAVSELMAPLAKRDATILMLDHEGVLGGSGDTDLDAIADRRAGKIDSLIAAVSAYASRCPQPLLVNLLPAVATPRLGYLDRVHPAGDAATADLLNRRLAELARTTTGIVLVDADAALIDLAPAARTDARLWYYGRIAYSDAAQARLADAFAAAWLAHERGPAKVLALDFDNTLWGGVYGDDGIDRLVCDSEAPGNAFKAFQQECLRLKAQGMLLVGLSKNNADAIDVFARHPGMALKASDFVATAVDWNAKPGNIRKLAAELNLGLDSFLFLDDSPHEREAMRRLCPSVMVPEMPADPALRPGWLRRLSATWPLRMTQEDQRRSEMYAAEIKGRRLREAAGSYDDYLRELEQRLVVAPVGPATLARVAQLHQRTNQFNLTTRRLGEAEISAMMADGSRAVVVAGSVSDRFGDHGLTLAAVATLDGPSARIESFLMSCRVIGRQIETAFLGALIERLRALGVALVEGEYRPTAKNGLVENFYATHGFVAGEARDGNLQWTWQEGRQSVPGSQFVAVTWEEP